MCIALILSSVDNRNVPWHIWQLTPLLFILHTKGIDLYPSISEDQKRKVICFCVSRLIPALVTETLLKSFHLEGWPRYLQSDPLTLFDSVLLLCCLFTKGCPLWRVCPCFLSSQRNIFLCKVVFRDLPSCWAGSSLSLSLAGLCKWGEDASRDNVWSVECQVKIFEKEQQHKK